MLICEAVEPDGKSCSKCGEYKPLAEFYRNTNTRSGYTYRCRKCQVSDARKWERSNPERRAKTQYQEHLRRVYGLTQCEFELMWRNQGGNCGLCYEPMLRGTGQHAIDHCHVTGRVRSILHSTCNTGFGLFKEDPIKFRLAAKYAERHNAA